MNFSSFSSQLTPLTPSLERKRKREEELIPNKKRLGEKTSAVGQESLDSMGESFKGESIKAEDRSFQIV